MKKLFFFLAALLCTFYADAQTEPANYKIAINKFKQLYNNNQPDSIYAMFGPEMKKAVAQGQFKTSVTQLRTQLGDLSQTTFENYTPPVAIYKATFKNAPLTLRLALSIDNQITGLLLQQYKDATPAASASPAIASAPVATAPVETTPLDPSLTESPTSIKTLSGTIYGTLTTPNNVSGKIPVVLIIAGSGPTDRDGNSPKLGLNGNTYRMLAAELGKKGIATVRYDKRMIGQSVINAKESDLRFEDYVDDAISWVQQLSEDQRFSKVIVLGHSEGALIGMLATADQPVKAYISVAGAGDPADKILLQQMKSKPPYMQDEFKAFMDTLKKGKTTDNIDLSLYFIARPSIQNYLMSWCRYNPQKVIKSVKVPVLILQGTTDLQITVDNAEKLKKAKSDATLQIITGMNHVLKEAPADPDQNMATYNKPELPLKPELVTDIVSFIGKLN